MLVTLICRYKGKIDDRKKSFVLLIRLHWRNQASRFFIHPLPLAQSLRPPLVILVQYLCYLRDTMLFHLSPSTSCPTHTWRSRRFPQGLEISYGCASVHIHSSHQKLLLHRFCLCLRTAAEPYINLFLVLNLLFNPNPGLDGGLDNILPPYSLLVAFPLITQKW